MRALRTLLVLILVLSAPFAARAADPWLEAGLAEEGRQALRAALATGMEKNLIAGGTLLLIKDGTVIFDEAFGFADKEKGVPFTTETVVGLASISQPHSATLILQLVEEGLIDLDEPVSTYVPAMARARLAETGEAVTAPTMRQLLSHTGGFTGLDAGRSYIPLVFGQPSMEAASEAIAEAGLAYRPGTDYAYTQLGFVIAAHAAERVTGKDFEVLIQERLLEPLGATRTSFFPSEERLAEMATVYNRREGALVPAAPRRYRPVGQTFDPAGSLTADSHGVARLFRLHLGLGELDGVRLLTPESVREMQTLQPGARVYGLGMNLSWMPKDGSGAIIRHGGASGTMAWADYEFGVVGVLLTQTAWRQVPEWSEIFYGALYQSGLGRMVSEETIEERGR